MRLSAAAERELANCCDEGLSAGETWMRLRRCGVALGERTVARYILAWRTKQAQLREAEAAEQRRLREMEAVGRGLASVRLGTAGVAEILESSAPGFRQKQADALRDLVGQFLERPTAGLLCGLSVGLHSFLLGAAMAESLERRRDG
ncbi:MAG TPA: hypothetical protein VGF03_04305 [Bryobacteraceae bacterium]|jgi:hypothetical protein